MLGGGSIYRLLNKNIKEFNKIKLSVICIIFLLTVGFISYKINSSYALFSDSITGEKTIEATVDVCKQNKPNAPELDSAMIPVYYDETSETWKKADSTNQNNNWYDYCEKKWANSVTVSSTNRSKYQSAEVGTEIPMDDILTMQVWIPRYKYKVWNYNADGTSISDEQEIKITFEDGIKTRGEITCEDSISGTEGNPSETCKLKETNETCTDSTCNNKTYTHPAFTFGDEEISGFWIGKYELTGTIDNITTKPGLNSLRSQTISSFETNIMKINGSDNHYGLNTRTDTHMIKNSEWGAVAYLSHSRYGTCTDGTCKEIGINNNSNYITGCGAVAKSSSSTACNAYNTNDGMLASTTENIYGVYDMSGGANEYTMANIVSNDGSIMMSGSSSSANTGYTGKLYDSGNYTNFTGTPFPNDKYYDKYSFGIISSSRIRSKLGDAIKEVYNGTSGWWNNISGIARSEYPCFAHGGNYSIGDKTGVFASGSTSGSTSSTNSTRLIITP